MTTVHIALTRACDRACAFCDVRAADARLPTVRAQAAATQLRAAVAAGATAVVLTGAEPTLEPYLVELVALAKRLGAADIGLQTHGGRIDARLAALLAAAGLRRAEVALNTLHPGTADAITGSQGDLKRSAAGIRALLGAGIDVDLAVALVAANWDQLADLCRRAGRLGEGCKGQLRRVLVRAIGNSPAVCELATLENATAALADAAHSLDASGPVLEQALGLELPPCLFAAPGDVAGLFRLSAQRVAREADRFRRLRACATCVLNDRCPGCPPAWADRAERLAAPERCVALADTAAPENSVLEHDDLLPMLPAALQVRWPTVVAGLGLTSPVALAVAQVDALCARRAPDHPQWPISAADCDREAVELRAGVRGLLRREVPDPSRVAGAVEALHRQGLCTRVVQSVVAGVAGQERTHVFAALDPERLAAAERLDPALCGDERAKADAIRQFGHWFGYPPCCVEAFVRGGDRDDAALVADRVRRQGRIALPWPTNWAVVPVRLGSFMPCAPDCAAALRHAQRVASLVQAAAPAWLSAARPLLQSAVLTLGFDRAAVLVGATAEADGFRFDRVIGPAQLAGQATFVPRLALLAFEWTVVEALRQADRVILEGHDLRLVRAGATTQILRFSAAPGVVDFTAAAVGV